jgi:hypothetical protein
MSNAFSCAMLISKFLCPGPRRTLWWRDAILPGG